MKTKKRTQNPPPAGNLRTVIRHIIKEELNLQASDKAVEGAANDFDDLDLDSYIDIVNAKQRTTKSQNPKYLLAAIEELVEEEYLPALKQKLIKRIMDRLLVT